MTPGDICIGSKAGAVGGMTVDGTGSSAASDAEFYVGDEGEGTLAVTGGASVTSGDDAFIGSAAGSRGTVRIDGTDSAWVNEKTLRVGDGGEGTLTIVNGGLVRVDQWIEIDGDASGDGQVNMAFGGMLALAGQADASLTDFLDLVYGTDAIRYWDCALPGWANITGATRGVDYELAYHASGSLAGHTVLTVMAMPEPGCLLLLASGLPLLLRRRTGR
jgi:T5SS/PEP-CTERM-associated repeat protein